MRAFILQRETTANLTSVKTAPAARTSGTASSASALMAGLATDVKHRVRNIPGARPDNIFLIRKFVEGVFQTVLP